MTILTLLHKRLEKIGYRVEITKGDGVKFNVIDPMFHVITIDAKEMAMQYGSLRFFHCETEEEALNNIVETILGYFEE